MFATFYFHICLFLSFDLKTLNSILPLKVKTRPILKLSWLTSLKLSQTLKEINDKLLHHIF